MKGKKFLQLLLSVLLACTAFVSGTVKVQAEAGCFEVMSALPSNHVKADENGTVRLEVSVDVWSDVEVSDISLQWYKAYTDENGTSREILEGETGTVLIVNDVSEKSEYLCVGTDPYGHEGAALFFLYPWSLFEVSLEGEAERIVEPGTTETIHLNVQSDTPVSFSWHIEYDGFNEDFRDCSPTYEFLDNNTDTLVLDDISKTQRITVVAEDENTAQEYFHISIKIENHLNIEAVDDINVTLGETADLAVNASADDMDDIQYYWFRHDLDGYDKMYIDGVNGPSYTTPPVTEEQQYTVFAVDKFHNMVSESFKVIPVEDKTGWIEYADSDSLYLKPGETGKLEVIAHNLGQDQRVNWETDYFYPVTGESDIGNITVDQEGNVTAGTKCGHGRVNAYLTTSDSSGTLSFNVYIYEDPEEVHFYYKDRYVVNRQSKPVYVSTYCLPENARYAPVTCTIQDTGIAKYEDKYIYGVSAGETTITASCGAASVTVPVIVVDGDYADSINMKEYSPMIFVGDSCQLEYILRSSTDPDKTEFADETVSFVSKNPRVLQVDENGLATGLKPGYTSVTATITNDNSVTYYLTVANFPTSVSFKEDADYRVPKTAYSVNLQDYLEIGPEDTVIGAYIVTSSDPSVLDPEENGYLTIRRPGKATITVTSKKDESITASHEFEVYETTVPETMTKIDNGDTVYKNYKYLLQVSYGPEDASTLTEWTLEEDDGSNSYRLDKLYDEHSNQAVLYVFGTGTVNVTAVSKTNPELSQTFTFQAVEGDEPIDAYTRTFYMNDTETDENIGKDLEEYVLELGKSYDLHMGYESIDTVPCNYPDNDFYHNSLFYKAFFNQITLAEKAPITYSGFGYSLRPNKVEDSDYVFFKTVSAGTQTFTYRGKTVRITVLDEPVDVNVGESVVYSDGSLDDDVLTALENAGGFGVSDALKNAVDVFTIAEEYDIPDGAQKFAVKTYMVVTAYLVSRNTDEGKQCLWMDFEPHYE